jgi:peptidoglycan hydrolase-like protein with peptidoglycan-binding domain
MTRVRRKWVAAGLSAAVAAGTVGWLVLSGDGGTDPAADAGPDLSTATVERRDLVERQTFDGSLGYADERSLVAARTGTVTGIADEGASLRRGDALYEVDERPVVLLYGEVPAYRALSAGVEGRDVRQLQRNLLALGYHDGGDLEVTGEFDGDTADVVRDWQEDLGLERTGVVELGDVVFAPGARRMGSHDVSVGSSVGAGVQVGSTTSLERVVTLELEASDQDLVENGDRVTIELPGGERVPGRVTSVARVAESDPEDPDAEPTVEVTVRPLRRIESDLDEAPVDVDVETSRADGVLAVPVQALLALAEGGYGVEIVDAPGRTRLVGVETGDFADGFVEIRGEDLREGLDVVTAS